MWFVLGEDVAHFIFEKEHGILDPVKRFTQHISSHLRTPKLVHLPVPDTVLKLFPHSIHAVLKGDVFLPSLGIDINKVAVVHGIDMYM